MARAITTQAKALANEPRAWTKDQVAAWKLWRDADPWRQHMLGCIDASATLPVRQPEALLAIQVQSPDKLLASPGNALDQHRRWSEKSFDLVGCGLRTL